MIRVILAFFIATLVGLFIQGAMIHSSFPAAMAPDFILVLMVLVALRHRSLAALFGVYCLGLLADFSSGQLIGPNAAASVIVFALVGMIASRVYADKMAAVVIITFICALAKSATCLAILALYLEAAQLSREVFQLVLVESVLTAVCAPLVFWFVGVGGYGVSTGSGRGGGYKYNTRSQSSSSSAPVRNRFLLRRGAS